MQEHDNTHRNPPAVSARSVSSAALLRSAYSPTAVPATAAKAVRNCALMASALLRHELYST